MKEKDMGKIVEEMCNIVQKSLKSVDLKYFFDDDGNHLPLVDLLSSTNTIDSGLEEIDNIVESIYFELDKYANKKHTPNNCVSFKDWYKKKFDPSGCLYPSAPLDIGFTEMCDRVDEYLMENPKKMNLSIII